MLTILQILLVCEYENDSISHFPVIDDTVQFLSGFINPISIGTVNNKYQSLCASVIVSP